MVPRIRNKIELPFLFLVLESSRKQISIGFWHDNIRQCKQVDILNIGSGEGQISRDRLGFDEIYFQYFVPVGYRTYAAFELEQEAILKKGYLVKFDDNWKFKSSEPMPELAENTMRPTACLLGGT